MFFTYSFTRRKKRKKKHYGLAHGLTIIPFALAGYEVIKTSSRETVNVSEQLMPVEKYPSIFSRQMEAIVLVSFK